MMYQYNYRALKTLKAMNLTHQATKSIRGQLLGMSESEADEYIRKIAETSTSVNKKIIANVGERKRNRRCTET